MLQIPFAGACVGQWLGKHAKRVVPPGFCMQSRTRPKNLPVYLPVYL
jgi:hypothetical protein